MRYNYEYKGLIALVEVLSERRILVPSDAALALPIPPKVRSHDAAHTIASLTLFLKHTASSSKYATHSSLS